MVEEDATSGGVTRPDTPDAIALARDVLEHIRDWATLDPEGQRFPWIAARTAEALQGGSGDLEAIRLEAEQFVFDSSPIGRIAGLLIEAIDYAAALEQDRDSALQRWEQAVRERDEECRKKKQNRVSNSHNYAMRLQAERSVAEWRTVAKQRERERDAINAHYEDALSILADLRSDVPCNILDNGYCAAHDWAHGPELPCPHQRLAEFRADWRALLAAKPALSGAEG